MAVSASWYGKGLQAALMGGVDLDSDTIKVTLHTATYTPDQDAHDFFDDATNELATASGYTAGGVALASKAASYDTASNEVRLDADDVAWTFSGSVTFRYAVIRKARGGASSADELIGWVDFGSSQTVSVPFTIVWAATGLLKVTAS